MNRHLADIDSQIDNPSSRSRPYTHPRYDESHGVSFQSDLAQSDHLNFDRDAHSLGLLFSC